MPRRPPRTVPVVLVSGREGSAPEHWLTWLADQLRAGREVRRLVLPDPAPPTLPRWQAALTETLDGLPDDGFDLICHFLGAVAWLHHVSSDIQTPRPSRVALVAPPSPTLDAPGLQDVLPPPLDVDAVRRAADGTVLICGLGDPSCPEGADVAYGRPLKLATTVLPDGGPPNAASGPWPAILEWCGRDNLAFY